MVTASESENDDLFWGIRGAAKLRHGDRVRIGSSARADRAAGLILWPIDRVEDVIRGWRDYVDAAPDELSTACVIITAPPEPFVPEALKGRLAVGMAAMYVGDPDQGADASTAQGTEARRGPDPADALHRFPGHARPEGTRGYRNYWRGEYLNSSPTRPSTPSSGTRRR